MSREITRRPRPAGADLSAAQLHPLLERVYCARGVQAAEQLDLDLKRLLPPSQLLHTQRAAELLAAAVESNKRILIVGDFDADGATSTALAVDALRRMGAEHVDYLVPNRFDYGYGLTPEIVALAASRNPDVIITVDNGISSVAGVAAANAAGIAVVVTDHHLPGRELPAATVIVNPNQHGCNFASKNLAGVGVIFYVMLGLRAQLRRRDWFTRNALEEPNLGEYVDLVALGTVADVVPLDHNNRILVAAGLKRMRAGRARPGIAALLEVAGRSAHNLVAADLGFALGPRLNAAGRLDDMSVGIECLLSEHRAVAQGYAAQLQQLNEDRKAIESQMQAQAADILAELDLDGSEPPLGVTLYRGEWHQGVIGILASRVKDRLHRPTIVFADSGDGEIKGSARSIPGLHIRDILDAVAAAHPALISKFGGHAMAAGLSLAREDYDAFSAAFSAEVARHAEDVNLQAQIYSDGELTPGDFDLQLAELLRSAGPWGQHFPEPVFDGEFQLVNQRLVGQKHLKLVVSVPDSVQVVDAIAFNVDLQAWPNPAVERVRMAYRLDVNEFRGQRSLQLMVEELIPLS